MKYILLLNLGCVQKSAQSEHNYVIVIYDDWSHGLASIKIFQHVYKLICQRAKCLIVSCSLNIAIGLNGFAPNADEKNSFDNQKILAFVRY